MVDRTLKNIKINYELSQLASKLKVNPVLGGATCKCNEKDVFQPV